MRASFSFSVLSVAFALSSPAFAQGGPAAGGLSSMPMVKDLAKVPVGSWAEYKIAGTMQGDMKMRFALVARDADTQSIEMTMDGGPAAMMGGKMITRVVTGMDATAGTPKHVIIQFGPNGPFEMPVQPGQPQPFNKPDPKTKVGTESITVAGGKFKADHYRITKDASTSDIWVSKDAPLMGMVKMTIAPPTGATGTPIAFELTSSGKGAKPEITKPAKPFDPAAMGAMMGRGPGGPGPHPMAAPPAPAPAPAPAAPAAPAAKKK